MTPPVASPRSPSTYRALFAVGEFRVLLAGFVLFGVGFQIEILGLSVLVYARTRSPLLGAVTFGIGFLPQVVGGALLTSLADRMPPRRAIALGLLLRASPGLAIGLAPALPVALMLAVVAIAAVFAPLVSAGTSGLLPDLLSGERYVLARSLFNFTMSATQLLGLAVGGAVLTVISPRHLLLLAGGALALAALLTRLGLRNHPARSGAADRSTPPTRLPAKAVAVMRTTVHGNVALLADARIRALMLALWLPAWLITGAESLIVPYVGSLGAPASAASALLAALPVGMLISNVVVGRFLGTRLRAHLVLPLALLAAVPLLGFLTTPRLAVAAVMLGLSGIGTGYALGLQQPFLDVVPANKRGQAFGLNSTGLMGGQGLTPPLAGAFATATGTGPAMALFGAAGLVVVLALRRTLYPGRLPPPPGTGT